MALLLLTSDRSEAKAVQYSSASAGHATAGAAPDRSAGAPGSGGGANALAPKILPFAVITSNFSLVPGQAYSLIYSDTTLGVSHFAIPDFNDLGGNIQVLRAWVHCGYNPLVFQEQWPAWCPQDANVNGATGPTAYWLGTKYPLDGPYLAPSLSAGEGHNGWWLTGQGDASVDPGTACVLLSYIVSEGQQDAVIPLVDTQIGYGINTFSHLRALYTFHIQNTYAVCNPPPGEPKSWYMEGVFLPK
jgi:hypothetical protein